MQLCRLQDGRVMHTTIHYYWIVTIHYYSLGKTEFSDVGIQEIKQDYDLQLWQTGTGRSHTLPFKHRLWCFFSSSKLKTQFQLRNFQSFLENIKTWQINVFLLKTLVCHCRGNGGRRNNKQSSRTLITWDLREQNIKRSWQGVSYSDDFSLAVLTKFCTSNRSSKII